MEATQAMVVDLKRNSLDDGPGIRTLVFFKGCPLRCVWCHNPETKHTYQELMFDAKVCISCGDCEKTCKLHAISLKTPQRINRELCNRCMECVEVCPSGALKKAGRLYTVDALFAELIKDEPFYRYSSGGITFSGGEPTVYMHFLSRLSAMLKSVGIHLNIETCGLYNNTLFVNTLLPHLDMIFFDLKFIDPELHKKYTGRTNEVIIKNFLWLHEHKTIPVIPRVPLIPDITTTEENLVSIANFLKQHNIRKVELLAYNPLWTSKASGLGHELVYDRKTFMRKDEIDRVKHIFRDFDTGKFQ
ncbi:MAG: glycyl-radical enzyme activating protein [bacterium]